MKKIIIFGFISLFSTVTTAQVLKFETVGSVDLCDGCKGSEFCMAKCNVCKGEYEDDFIRLFRYETDRLMEINKGCNGGGCVLSKDERERQWINLKAHINSEINRIKESIRFCVQSEMRREEVRTAEAAVKKAQESATTYTPSVAENVKVGVANNIKQSSDVAADRLKYSNEGNVKKAEDSEKEIAVYEYQKRNAEIKKDEIYAQAATNVAIYKYQGTSLDFKEKMKMAQANSQKQLEKKEAEAKAKAECLAKEEEAKKVNTSLNEYSNNSK